MPTPAADAVLAAPDYGYRESGAVTPSATNSSPSPSAVGGAAEAAMLGNVSSSDTQNHNHIQRSDNIRLSKSDIKMLVLALKEERHRDEALRILSTAASYRPNLEQSRASDLAPLLWHTPEIVFILLKEVMAAYKLLDKEDILKITVVRVDDAICLLQSIAMHSGLRKLFVQARIPAYVYPFLRLRETSQCIEKLRIASLGVIGSLVKTYDPEVVHYLLDSEVFPCCLCSLEFGSQFAKTVVAFVISKLLSCKEGVHYCCSVSERFLSVLQVFLKIVEQTAQLNDSTIKLLRFVVGSYGAFAGVPSACRYLRTCFPSKFSNVLFLAQLAQVEPKLYVDLTKLCDKINEEVIHLGIPPIGFGLDPQ